MTTCTDSSRSSRPPGAVEPLEQRLALSVFTVSNLNDTGPGSLRQAVTDANAVSSDDVIAFDAAFFSVPREIQVVAALPQFGGSSGALSIVGPGSSLLTVRKTGGTTLAVRRVFDSAAPRLSISGMTITGGNISGGATSNGGALNVGGTQPDVVLDDTVFTGNTANFNNNGGAIAVMASNATLTLRNSRVTGNSGRVGGGIYFSAGGSLLIENSTVADNQTFSFGLENAGGGGVYFFGAARSNPPAGYTPNTLVVRNSTFSGNTARYNGGGFALTSFSGTLLIENSTFSGNRAGRSGGAISISGEFGGGPGGITLRNSTVTDNTSEGSDANFNPGSGGGISRVSGETGVIDIVNSVVAGNHHAQGDAPDIRADAPFNVVRLNNSLVGSNDGFTVSNPSANNLPFGTDPLLGPLADNGGATKTHALLPGSPLLNAGDNARVPAALTTDQRGPGHPRIVGPAVDVGAFERVEPPAPRVTGVFVRNSAWERAFLDFLQAQGRGDSAAGYLVPAGAGQLLTLPWTAIDRVSVRFSAPVTAWLGAFTLKSVTGSVYATEFLGYDVATNTATWRLPVPLARDRVRLELGDMNGPAGQLDGEWSDGAHAYPSGDGTAGGAFHFALNVLPGDVNQSGSVLADDYSSVKKKFFKDTTDATNTDAGYSPLHDVDGSGVILANDFSEVKKRFFDSLPPAAAGVAGASAPRRIRPAAAILE